jgi:pSer/pThr/pTyr-binding forkhead associated (FHA) protein
MNKHSIDLLLAACGVSGQLRVNVDRGGQLETAGKRLFLPLAVIGRNENADLSLDDPQVSQRHTCVQVIGGRLFAADLSSRTGTNWPGAVNGAGWLEPNEKLIIGPFSVWFDGTWAKDGALTPSNWNPLANLYPDRKEGPLVLLELVDGPSLTMTWRIHAALTLVGRSKVCGIPLLDPTVSSVHCSLLRSPIGTWATDLLGRSGITLNGRRVRWGRLDDGDHLQIGKFVFRVRHAASAVASGHMRPKKAAHTEDLADQASEAQGASQPDVESNRETSPDHLKEPATVLSVSETIVDPHDLAELSPPPLLVPGQAQSETHTEPASELESDGSSAGAQAESESVPLIESEAEPAVSGEAELETADANLAEPESNGNLGGELVPVSQGGLVAGGASEAFLLQLFNQFAAMQHQMLDQFQQAITMMVEMFTEMQRDQVGAIQQEVDRLQQITAELQVLQAELAARQAAPEQAAAAEAPPEVVAETDAASGDQAAEITPAADEPAPIGLHETSVTENGTYSPHAIDAIANLENGVTIESDVTPDTSQPAVDQASQEDLVADDGPVEQSLNEPATGGSPIADEVGKEKVLQRAPAASSSGTGPTFPQKPPSFGMPPSPQKQSDGEVHLWLYQKIESLQKERHSRLQKILSFLRGK